MTSRPPDALLAKISSDLKPVRPVPVPWRLTMRVLPFAALAALVLFAARGLRRDAMALGPAMTWGASAAQFGFGALLVWIAGRESTPGRRLPERLVYFALGGVLAVMLAMALWTFEASPTDLPRGISAWRAGVACGLGATISGSLLVLFVAWVFRRSLAARPGFAGALYGAGAGVAVNAGWRLSCPISTPSHSVVAHGAAVVITAVLGAVSAVLVARLGRAVKATARTLRR
jgi:hypothetical protein